MKHWKKSTILLVSAVLVLTAAVGTTLAYLIAGAGPVTNIFTPSKVTTEVDEKTDNGVKSNVKIKNTGDTEAWIRAAVIVTWQDEDGNVYGKKPVESADYSITWSGLSENSAAWFEKDGFYYHKDPVAAGKETSVLFTACSPVSGKAPEGYSLNVEILGSGIQAKPETVVSEAWPAVTVSNGKLAPKSN